MKTKIFIFLILICVSSNFAFAKKDDTSEKGSKITSYTTDIKSIIGDIGVIRDDYITVIYNRKRARDGGIAKEYEMVFPIDATLKLLRKSNLNELNEGDRIEIQYEEVGFKDEKGIDRIERRAKQIKFLRPAATALQSR